ncbi:MAG: formylmethanofuran dehydrogenase subunit C, partial [Archaeoglobaceae archaeon]
VSGNAGDILGEKMSGGEIIVEGNAGHWVGDDMSGGVIKIKGEFTPSEERTGGEIYRWRDGWVKI